MSERIESRNEKARSQDGIGFALILLGGFGAVSIVLYLRGQQPLEGAASLVTAPVVQLVELVGAFAALALCGGLTALGTLLFLRTTALSPLRPMAASAALALGLALILGAVGRGGELGALLPDMLAGFTGRALDAVLGLAVGWLGFALLSGARAPRESSADAMQRIGLAARHESAAGVSPAEAALLVTEPRAPAAPRREEARPIRVETIRPYTPKEPASARRSEAAAMPLVTPVRPAAPVRPPATASAPAATAVEPALEPPPPPSPSWEQLAEADEEPAEASREVAPEGDVLDALAPLAEPEPVTLETLVASRMDLEVELGGAVARVDEDVEDIEGAEDGEEDLDALDDDDDADEEPEALRAAAAPAASEPAPLASEIAAEFDADEVEELDELDAEADDELEELERAPSKPRASWEQVGLFDEHEEEEEAAPAPAAPVDLTPTFDFEPAAPRKPSHEPEPVDDPFALEPALSAPVAPQAAALAPHVSALAPIEPEAAPESQEEIRPARPRAKRAPKAPKVPKAAEPAAAPAVEPVRVADAQDGPWERLVYDAGLAILEQGRVAVSMLERKFSIDFDQACRVLDELQQAGLIGPYMGGRTRDILLTREEWLAHAPHAP